MSEDGRWSEAADISTRMAFDEGVLGMLGSELHCKHIAGGFGTVQAASVATGKIVVVQGSEDRTLMFRSIEEFIQAGWTID